MAQLAPTGTVPGSLLVGRITTNPPLGPGDPAPHQQKVVLRVDPHNFQIANGRAGVAVMARHLLAANRPAGIGTAAGAAYVPVTLLHAVRGTLATEIVTLHGTGRATALADEPITSTAVTDLTVA